MMPINFHLVNAFYGKPPDMTDEECVTLPVFKGFDRESLPCLVSCWKLSKEDIDEIQQTGLIYLKIIGHNMPPVCVATEIPI